MGSKRPRSCYTVLVLNLVLIVSNAHVRIVREQTYERLNNQDVSCVKNEGIKRSQNLPLPGLKTRDLSPNIDVP